MCIFEYWIVTSLGVLFIPCILFDGTKTYASKLIQLYVSFFIKTTVMFLCIFWTFSAYIHAATTAAVGAAMAKKSAGMAMKKAAPVVRGANAGIAEGAAAAAGAWKGAGEAGVKGFERIKMASRAAFKQTAAAFSSGIKDQACRFISGKESSSHNASSLHVGVGDAKTLKLKPENANKDGTLTFKNISEAHAAQSKQKAQQIEAEKAKQQQLQQADKISFFDDEEKSNLE